VTTSHYLAPLRLPQREDASRCAGIRNGEHHDIDLDLSPFLGVVDDAVTHLSGKFAE
jgi:hypothetical protein